MTSRDALQSLLVDDPHLSAAELARRLGISRERVRQIALSLGITLTKWRRYQTGAPPTCPTPPISRIITGGVEARLHPTAAGTIGELLVAADLMARGHTVFFPLTRIGACDMVTVTHEGRVEKIEVKCAKRDADGRVQYTSPERPRHDRLALVVRGEPVLYRPPFDELSP